MMSILQLFTRTHRPLTLGLLLAAVLLAFLVSDAWGLLALALSAFWLLLMRRDAPRPVPSQAGAVLCPADGRVVRIEKARDPYADREALRISVFMNVFDTHANRASVDGVIRDVKYFPGATINTDLDTASPRNERNAVVMAEALQQSTDASYAAVGTPVFALVRDKKVPMAVTSTPFVPNRYHRG